MTAFQVVRESMGLLSKRDRALLGLITLAQVATGFLDLLGVLLIGVVSILSVAAVTGTALPGAVQSVIDRLGLEGVDTVTLAGWFIALAGLALVLKSLLSVLLTRRALRFLASRQADLSARLTAALLSRPLLDVQRTASQDVAFVLTIGTQAATVGVLGSATNAVADVALLVVLGIGLTAIDPTVTIFAAGFFGLLALIMHRTLSRWATRIGQESTDVNIESYRVIQEALATYREVMVTDRRAIYVDRIQRLRWRSASLSADGQFMALIPKYVFEGALVVGAIGLAASQLSSKGATAAIGIIAVFLVAGSRIMPAILRIQVTALTLRQSEPAAATAFDLARELSSTPSAVAKPPDVETIRRRLAEGFPDFRPTVRLHDVWLTYPGTSKPALAGVSLDAAEGSSVALVGSTGAGKSTMADVLLGVVEPETGYSLIGGVPAAQALQTWPGGIAYVPQEVALINGTIRDNVALGLPRDAIDDAWVWAALERAHLAAFLSEGREGLETFIGENGMRLSGGQRQRLGVARALFTKPRLLVLDEATSALDAETEQAIADTLKALEGEVTTVTIAHRLATIRHCDIVVFLEGGRVAAEGTFAEVRAQSSAFDRQAQLLGL